MKLLNLLILIIGLSSSAFAQKKQFKPKKGMKQITPIEMSIDVEIGQKLYYSGDVHSSVGKGMSVRSKNDSVIQLKDTHFAYKNRKKSKLPGGDSGTKTFIFEAISVGKSIIVIEENFRGDLVNKYNVEITVRGKNEGKLKIITDKKLKEEKDTIQLIPFKTKETIQLGQKLKYTGRVHGSVGSGVNVWEENNGVLKLIDSQFQYDHPQVKGMSGGDAGTKTFVFEPIKLGQSTITIQETYRGEIKNEFKIIVYVVDKK
ncbi:MAG: hypothetical protein MK066_03090 [Crocinitomicaceae bacterium]|nr:hypothetical protein [Crocinitomicaceae bacterium]